MKDAVLRWSGISRAVEGSPYSIEFLDHGLRLAKELVGRKASPSYAKERAAKIVNMLSHCASYLSVDTNQALPWVRQKFHGGHHEEQRIRAEVLSDDFHLAIA